MPVSKKLREFLDENHVKYVVVSHSKAYTAQEVAAALHIKGKILVKSIIVKSDGEYAMVVLSADCRINFDMLKTVLGKDNVGLASEEDFKSLFPECEIGAMPPFGNLYDLKVYMAESLLEDEEIAFNAGTHTEVIRVSMEDYKRLANPEVAKISEHM